MTNSAKVSYYLIIPVLGSKISILTIFAWRNVIARTTYSTASPLPPQWVLLVRNDHIYYGEAP
jgi:hypothetical protein